LRFLRGKLSLKKDFIYIFALVLVLVVGFYPVIFNNKTFFTPIPNDKYGANMTPTGPSGFTDKFVNWNLDPWGYINIEVPGLALMKKELSAGKMPLWDPFVGAGTSLAANSIAGFYNIFHLPMYIFNSMKTWDYYILSRFLTAGILAYFYFKKLGVARWIAFWGGVTWMFSGFFVLWTNLWFLPIDAMLPGLLLLIECYLQERSYKSFLLIPLIVGVMIGVGNLQPLILILIFSTMYFVARFFEINENARPRDITRPLIEFLLLIVLGFLILMPYLYQFYTVYKNAWSIHDSKAALLAVQPILVYPTYLVEAYIITPYKQFGSLVVNYVGPRTVWIPYLLTSTFLAAFMIKIKKKSYLPIFLIAYIFLYLTKIFVNPFFLSWIDRMPIMSNIFFSKYQGTLTFAIIILSVMGLKEASSKFDTKKIILPTTVFAGALVAGGIFRNELVLKRSEFLLVAGVTVIFYILYIITLLAAGRSQAEYKNKIIALFLVLCIVEALVYLPHNFAPIHNPLAAPDYVTFLQNKLKSDSSRVIGEGYLFGPQYSEAFGIQNLGTLDPIMPNRYSKFVRKYVYKMDDTGLVTVTYNRNILDNRFIDLLGVKYYISEGPISNSRWREVYWDKSNVHISENINVFPRAFLVYNTSITKNETESFEKVSVQNFNLSAVIEGGKSLSGKEPIQAVTIEKFESNEISLIASPKSDSYLVMMDTYFPGWSVYVDGHKSEILPANYLGRGVFLSAGQHRVRFKYEPAELPWLYLISSIGISGAVCWAGYVKKHKNKIK